MDVSSFREKYQRLKGQAQRVNSSGSLAAVYEMVLADLELMEVPGVETRYLSCQEVADALGLTRKTVAAWCREGRFVGAKKSGEQDGGNWLIPSEAAYRVAETRVNGTTLKLWRNDAQRKAS